MIELPLPWGDRAIVVRDVEDPERWLRAEELAVAHAFPREKRRNEWTLARAAARILAQRLGVERPFVSFSHSGPWAAAAIDARPVGIDVEVIRDVDERAARHFLTDSEAEQMRACTIPHRLLHFWCAKEAAWKQRGGAIPFLKQVPLTLIQEGERGLLFDAAGTYATEDVVVALAPPSS